MCSGRKKRRKLIIISLLIAVSLFTRYILSNLAWPTTQELIDLGKCPSCFGVTMCPAFLEGQITLNSINTFSDVVYLFGSKNVYFGNYKDKKIVLKKLGHTWELERLDLRICEELRLGPRCLVRKATWQIAEYLSSIARHVSLPLVNGDRLAVPITSSLHLCPTTANLEAFLSKVVDKNKGISTKVLYTNIWTLVLINPEPLILQIIPEEEGWPVPKYYGACGRVVVVEYSGEMLTSFHQAPWMTRADIAYQLVVAANQFTEKHPDFSFYLTDLSPDNIAIDSRRKVKFVDLEHVIVVDKNVPEEDKPFSWGEAHISENFNCKSCFAFSREEICSHRISDHNYYAVCQHLLAPDTASNLLPGGLLHGIPPHVQESHPELLDTIHECAQSTKQHGRFQAAQQLTTMLANITGYDL